MVARLTCNDYDYCATEWGGVELSESWASYRSFWAAVLSFAAADGADAVCYRPGNNDKCLVIETGGDRYGLEPPPEEYRHELLSAVERLAGGGVGGVFYHRLIATLTRSTYRGHIVLETPGVDVHWEVHAFPDGIRLQRV